MKKKVLGTIISMVLAVSMLAGCGGSSSSGSEPASGSSAPAAAVSESSSQAESEATAEAASGDGYEVKNYKIGYISWTSSHPVATAWNEGIEAYLEECNSVNVEYTMFDGENSAETQNRIMNDLMNQHYDAIILQASDGAAVASTVKEVEAAGIPVICLNLDATVPHAGFVSMPAYAAGYAVGDAMAEQLNEEGNVVIIQGLLGTSAAIQRESGFRDAIAKYPNIEIIAAQPGDFDKEQSITVMNNFLQAYSDIDGVFGVNDNSAEAAYTAAEAAGRQDEMVIWGDDGQRSTIEMIEAGKIDGTCYTNCHEEGALAMQLAICMAQCGYDLSTIKETGVIELSPVIVTKDTAGNITDEDRWG